MYCTSCGTQIPDGALYCPQCGTLIASVPDATVSNGAQIAGGASYGHTGANDPRLKDVKDYIFQNILALFLCLPLGIAGIIQGYRCKGAKKRGNFVRASEYSGYAKFDYHLSCIVFLIVIFVLLARI